MARARLLNWQMNEAEIAGLEQGGAPQHAVVFRAPIEGVVLEKMATAGMRFMPGDVLYQLADLRTVWLMASVYEEDLSMLQLDQPVTLEVDAWPGEVFAGHIAFISPTVAIETRTVEVRVELDNADMRVRPGM
jgi:Cu(I)/Ag(I) efflux system membrane fusion protein